MSPEMTPLAAAFDAPPSALRRDDPRPLHTRIREDLRERIALEDWAVDRRMPSEAELTRHYGVSRITVRQALHTLEQQGLIVKVPGKGSFVAAAAKPYQPLARLQGLAEAMAPRGHAVRNRVLRLDRTPADAGVAARLGVAAGTAVTHVRRLRLLDGRPVSVDLSWLPLALGDRLDSADLERRDIFVLLEDDFDTPLGHAELALDAIAAPADIARELGVAAGSALLHVERLTHDRAGRPVDYEHLYCRGDDFQLRLRIERHSGAQQ
jgi:GntR family transcriptional regulator